MSVNLKTPEVLVHGAVDPSLFDLLKKRKVKTVIVPEGRPGLEAVRQNSRQLLKRRMAPVMIADNMAGFLFSRSLIREIWLGCQIGDAHGALCDIGGLIFAVLARKHKVPVFAYPSAEKKRFIGKPREIFYFNHRRTAPAGINGYVPLLEWVPGKYLKELYE